LENVLNWHVKAAANIATLCERFKKKKEEFLHELQQASSLSKYQLKQQVASH